MLISFLCCFQLSKHIILLINATDDDTDVITGVNRFIEENLDGRHIRFKKGYRHVIELGRTTDNCVVAVECSGHGAWRDNGWVDDGCYTAVRLIAELMTVKQQAATNMLDQISISNLITELQEPCESIELRCKVLGGREAISDTSRLALAALENTAALTPLWKVEKVNYEGLRVAVLGDIDGWCVSINFSMCCGFLTVKE